MEIEHSIDNGSETWTFAGDDDVLRVSVTRSSREYEVLVGAAEFVRDEPLEGRMRATLAAALAAVYGVTAVGEMDREMWIVEGRPSGEHLARAAGTTIEGLADELFAHLESLG